MAMERTIPRTKPGIMPLCGMNCGVGWAMGLGCVLWHEHALNESSNAHPCMNTPHKETKRYQIKMTHMNKLPRKVAHRTINSLLVMRRRASQSHSTKSCVCWLFGFGYYNVVVRMKMGTEEREVFSPPNTMQAHTYTHIQTTSFTPHNATTAHTLTPQTPPRRR